MRFSAKDICARIFARIALSGHVGYISLDATFFMYSGERDRHIRSGARRRTEVDGYVLRNHREARAAHASASLGVGTSSTDCIDSIPGNTGTSRE